jgi:hypothetical protein
MWGWILFRKSMHEDAPKVHARCSIMGDMEIPV